MIAQEVDLSPAGWPQSEQKKFAQLNQTFGGQNGLATSDKAVITGTTNALAIRAGLEALNQGGSAADAVLTTSLTQIALAKGCWVSYAGIITMVYYDAETEQVYCMNAGYNTILDEDDPMSIPVKASGRTALVPGYMAGVEAAHQRFGKLPFREIFTPAIYYAENGFELHSVNAAALGSRHDVLSRFSETKQVFWNPDTDMFYKEGELFRQPQLAETLRKVSEQGADYMYSGDWGKKLVESVQADGGKMTEQDLSRYRVRWTNPIRIEYGHHEIFAPGLPAQGGVHIAESLHLVAEADLKSKGHFSDSAESFFWLSQFNTVFTLSFLAPEIQELMVGSAATLDDRRKPEFASDLWHKMQAGEFSMTQKPESLGDNHSDAVIAIDRWGNVAAIVHTINTVSWGQTGLFVDGVSIPDSAAFQQSLIAQTKPGDRLPDPTAPLIVMRQGKPVAALSSIGGGLHAKTMTTLINILDYDQDIKTAVDGASMHLPEFGVGGQPTQQVFQGDFSDDMIEEAKAMGLRIKVLPKTEASGARGYVVGATIDSKTGKREAVATKIMNAAALGGE